MGDELPGLHVMDRQAANCRGAAQCCLVVFVCPEEKASGSNWIKVNLKLTTECSDVSCAPLLIADNDYGYMEELGLRDRTRVK